MLFCKSAEKRLKPHIVLVAVPLEKGASGIGVYIMKMVEHLSRFDDIRLTVLGFADERHLLDIGASAEFVEIPRRYSSLAANLLWHSTVLPLLCMRLGADVLFLPAGNRRMSIAPPLVGYKVAATVHDLAQFHLPQKYDRLRTFYVTKVLPALWRKTPKIVAVSHATAKDLAEITKVEKNKISVVWNGVEHEQYYPMPKKEARERIPEEFNLPQKYMIYVSRIEHPGKNHVGLLRAYRMLLDKYPDLEQKLLFCGGMWNGGEVVLEEISRLGLDKSVHMAGFVKQDLLPYLYCAADLLVFPSLFEGFGIPVIEAMAVGVPVAVSNRASLPEIVGEAGLLFDPEDVGETAAAMEHGLFDGSFRKRAQKDGPERSEMFSWRESAEKTLQALVSLIGQ